MAAHHFCCCLPIRLGAFLISLFQFVIAGFIAAALWYEVSQWHGDIPTKTKVTYICRAVYYTIFSLSSFFGFVGTLKRSASLLAQYASYLGWAVFVQIVLDALYLWAFFTVPRDTFIKDCINGSTDQNVINACNNFNKWGKGYVIASVAVGLLVQAYAWYIVNGYSHKLDSEIERKASVPMDSGYKYAAAGRASTEALTGPSYNYPYADQAHSFGGDAPRYDPPSRV
ncbi:hypothetical protein DENSPDRAFT_836489 [Dentipellis sp. KUC8613]|nr:hypothetical protein DENSPDRAFT_836489 [Dentipellis sp. KUC8613]